jgi:hypothetical protein
MENIWIICVRQCWSFRFNNKILDSQTIRVDFQLTRACEAPHNHGKIAEVTTFTIWSRHRA